MKKIVILALVIVITAVFFGCAVKGDSMTVEEGILRVGMDLQYPPFETFDDNNEPKGISVDVAAALAEELGLKLEVVNMDFSTLIPALETDDIDIAIASMSITEEREKKVDFTDPYFYFKIVGLMNKTYADKHSLDNTSVADDLWAIENTRFVGLSGQISVTIPEEHGFEVLQAVDKSAAITEIVNGDADILLISPEVVVGAYNANPDSTSVFWSALDVSPIGMAVAEGNTELLKLANNFIDNMNKSGGIYDKLREDYSETLKELYGEGFSMDNYIYE